MIVRVILLIGSILAVAVGVWLVRRWRSEHRAADPTCGHCGYIVTGLTTFVCPECGSDLREVGIVRGSSDRPRRPWPPVAKLALKLLAWTLVAAFLAYAAFGIVEQFFWPLHLRYDYDIEIAAKSGAFKNARLHMTAKGIAVGKNGIDHAMWKDRFAQFQIFTGQRDQMLGVNYERGDCFYTRPDRTQVQVNGMPTDETVLKLLESAGVKTADPRVTAEAQAIVKILSDFQQYPRSGSAINALRSVPAEFSTYSPSGGMNVEPYDTLAYLAVAFGLMVWTPGALVLVRRWRRLPVVVPVEPEPPPKPPSRGEATARTLTVMFSDIQNYTASTASAERMAVLELVRRHRDSVAPIAKRRGGRIVKSLGDGLLLTFDSATDAIRAGLEIQATVEEMSRMAFRKQERLALRIGIATGEVVIADGDVLGEPVNLASRIQQLAAAGEVLFAESTWGMINRHEVVFEEMGAHELKGVPGPVRLFRARKNAEENA
jgi:class 3 adenylate cyclase/predicted RNA-binding Zn-ribbon protein involved in translation (DUF1610 family)